MTAYRSASAKKNLHGTSRLGMAHRRRMAAHEQLRQSSPAAKAMSHNELQFHIEWPVGAPAEDEFRVDCSSVQLDNLMSYV
jgi:hypothetical protein